MTQPRHLRPSALRRRHYVRKASSWNYWFDFSKSRMEAYEERYGADFCLVIHGAVLPEDSYVIPWAHARSYFAEELLDHRKRWVGTIIEHRLKLGPANTHLPVAHFRNRLDLLQQPKGE